MLGPANLSFRWLLIGALFGAVAGSAPRFFGYGVEGWIAALMTTMSAVLFASIGPDVFRRSANDEVLAEMSEARRPAVDRG